MASTRKSGFKTKAVRATVEVRPKVDSVALQKIIDDRMADSRVSANDLSFNELLDMYREGELIITPEFQRTFRWSQEQQSRFIESLLLELPIPPIFLVELETGKLELVDGLQRISSYLHFRGFLPDLWVRRDKERMRLQNNGEDDSPAKELPMDDEVAPDNPEALPPESPKQFLQLDGCEIIPELNTLYYRDLPVASQIGLKRYFVRTFTVRRASRADLKYHMFKRLNQGGSRLTDQELRNCFVRIVGEDFIKFVNRCSHEEDFWTCVKAITQKAADQLYHQELALRFFAFKNDMQSYKHDIGPFLDNYLEGVSAVSERRLPFDYENESLVFSKTFACLRRASGEDCFQALHPESGTPIGFRSLLFEAISLGLQSVVTQIDPDSESHMERLRNKLREIKSQEDFRKLTTGGGKNTSLALSRRIAFVRTALESEFNDLLTTKSSTSTKGRTPRKRGTKINA